MENTYAQHLFSGANIFPKAFKQRDNGCGRSFLALGLVESLDAALELSLFRRHCEIMARSGIINLESGESDID